MIYGLTGDLSGSVELFLPLCFILYFFSHLSLTDSHFLYLSTCFFKAPALLLLTLSFFPSCTVMFYLIKTVSIKIFSHDPQTSGNDDNNILEQIWIFSIWLNILTSTAGELSAAPPSSSSSRSQRSCSPYPLRAGLYKCFYCCKLGRRKAKLKKKILKSCNREITDI